MKKFLLLAAMATLCGSHYINAEETDSGLIILTFEDEDYKGDENFAGECNWSSLISNPQYGGKMLYGPDGWGVMEIDEAYWWCDQNNTNLFHRLSEGWGTWCYWSGGHAISNYGTSDIEGHGDFTNQLTIFNKDAEEELTREGHGHNGSNNFAVHFGYADNSGYGLGEEALPFLEFNDGIARVIDHMYITNTTYSLNCYVNGNSLTANIGDDDWVKIHATGYLEGVATGSVEFYLCNGPDNIITEWTKFDLSPLGLIHKVTFNILGSSDNGYGFSQPAYFAYDDVAVRTGNASAIDNISLDNVGMADDAVYDLAGRRYIDRSSLRPGIYISNGKKFMVK